MQEIQAEITKLQVEKVQLELELNEDNTAPVAFEQVRELIYGFNQVLTASPFEQRKTSLHLFIKRITMNESKKIELCFDEYVDSFFFDSPVAVAAWDIIQQKQARRRERIEITLYNHKEKSYMLLTLFTIE